MNLSYYFPLNENHFLLFSGTFDIDIWKANTCVFIMLYMKHEFCCDCAMSWEDGDAVKGGSVNCNFEKLGGLSGVKEARDITKKASTDICLPCLLIRFKVRKVSWALIVFDGIQLLG